MENDERTFPDVSIRHDSKGWRIVIETSGKMTKDNIQYIEQIIRSLEEKDEQTFLELSETNGRSKTRSKKID